MPIQDFCMKTVITIDKDSSLAEAAKSMKKEGVGALVITDKNKKPVGILTDRDIAIGAVAEGKPMSTKVEELMAKKVLQVSKDAGVADVIGKMEERQVRRAVVVSQDGNISGLVSSDDLLQVLGNELNSLGNLVGKQVSNTTVGKAMH